jgi:hypothetical protein
VGIGAFMVACNAGHVAEWWNSHCRKASFHITLAFVPPAAR